jgi:steroid Delta-isomerase
VTGRGLLQEHVARFNDGVRTGDWEPMLEQFEDDSELEFRGVPAGPYAGKDAIRTAYREQPPDDELRVLESRERGDVIEARYAWLAEPDVAVGELLLTSDDGLVRRLVVTFERDVRWS